MADNNQYEITAMNSHGEGIARIGGKVYFTPKSCIGDWITPINITEEKHFGRISEYKLVKKSPHRQTPPCSHFGVCGGCDYLHIDYETQLQIKQELVKSTLTRIGKLEENHYLHKNIFVPIIASPKIFNYRNKVQFHNSPAGFGFNKSASHEVEVVSECLLLEKDIQPAAILKQLTKYLNNSPLGPQKVANCNLLCAEQMEAPKPPRISLDRALGEASTFSQVNQSVNEIIQNELIALLSDTRVKKPRRLLDLYAGNGNLSLPLAPYYDEIIGVDLAEKNIDLANTKSQKLRSLPCTIRYEKADCFNFVRRVSQKVKKGHYDTIILDPPRKGAKELIGAILNLAPRNLLYLSCDPATLARDLKGFTAGGYSLTKVTPFDMFPHTRHVETLVLLNRRAES